MRVAADGEGTGGTPAAAVASVTGFAPAAKSEANVVNLGTSAEPLDFVSCFDVMLGGLNFDSREPLGMIISIR